jgi:hypothetical protein
MEVLSKIRNVDLSYKTIQKTSSFEFDSALVMLSENMKYILIFEFRSNLDLQRFVNIFRRGRNYKFFRFPLNFALVNCHANDNHFRNFSNENKLVSKPATFKLRVLRRWYALFSY